MIELLPLDEVYEIEEDFEKIDFENLSTEEQFEAYHVSNELAKQDYLYYFRETFPPGAPLVEGRHIRFITDKINQAIRGNLQSKSGFTKMMFLLPPRHLKTTLTSYSLPSYFLSLFPNKRAIVASYSDSIAERAGRSNRELIHMSSKEIFVNTNGELESIELRKDKYKKKDWETNQGGGMLASPIMGAITGSGADLLIIDDPFKNKMEAYSPTYRQRVWDEWEFTLKTRCHKNAIIILVMTPWHSDDLRGRLLELENDWIEYRLPAIAEENDLLGRKEGEPLWKENGYDLAYFAEFMRNKRMWAALYQCRPTLSEGNHFKASDFRYFDEYRNETGTVVLRLETDNGKFLIYKRDCICFQTIDTAMKTNEENDFTAISTWLYHRKGYLLLYDVFREKIEVPDQWNTIKSYKRKHNANQYLEDKQSGTGLLQKAKRTGIPARELKADTDKITRSFSIQTMYQNHLVFHHTELSHLGAIERELLEFPAGEHDDFVDTASYAGIVVENEYSYYSEDEIDGADELIEQIM